MSRDYDKIRKLVRSIILEDAASSRPANVYITAAGKQFRVPTFQGGEDIELASDLSDKADTSKSSKTTDDASGDGNYAVVKKILDGIDVVGSSGDAKVNARNHGIKITQLFSQGHGGIDIAYVDKRIQGEPVYAINTGTVKNVQKTDLGPQHMGGAGKFIEISHSDEKVSSYMHLDTTEVDNGVTVSAGQRIGSVGKTGNARGAHLHLEIEDSSDKNFDPIEYFRSNINLYFPVPSPVTPE